MSNAGPAQAPRILVVGYATTTYYVLKSLYDIGHPPIALLTLSAEKLQRFSDKLSFDHFAESQGLEIHEIDNVNDAKAIELIERYEPDSLFVMGWSQVVGQKVISLLPRGCFGLHPTYLPKNKGRAPNPWTILKGEKEAALSLFTLAEHVDEGPIHVQVVFPLDPRETATTLYEKINRAIERGIPQLVEQIKADRLAVVCNDQQESYNFIRRASDGWIDWTQSAESIDRLVRAVTHPYPGAFTIYCKRQLTIWKSALGQAEGKLSSYSAQPGQVVGRDCAGNLLVHTGGGLLAIVELQLGESETQAAADVRIPEGHFLGLTPGELAMEMLQHWARDLSQSS